MPTATLTSKGQVTIPKQVRDSLGVATGDRLEFLMDRDGSVRLRPLTRSVRELAGILDDRHNRAPISLQEMDQSIEELISNDDERIQRGG